MSAADIVLAVLLADDLELVFPLPAAMPFLADLIVDEATRIAPATVRPGKLS